MPRAAHARAVRENGSGESSARQRSRTWARRSGSSPVAYPPAGPTPSVNVG